MTHRIAPPLRVLLVALCCACMLIGLAGVAGAQVVPDGPGGGPEANQLEPIKAEPQEQKQDGKRYVTIIGYFGGDVVYPPAVLRATGTAQLATSFDASQPDTECPMIRDRIVDPPDDPIECDITLPDTGDQFPLVVRLPGYVPRQEVVTADFISSPGRLARAIRIVFNLPTGFVGTVVDRGGSANPPAGTVELYVNDSLAASTTMKLDETWTIEPLDERAVYSYRIVVSAPGYTTVEVKGTAQPYSRTEVPDIPVKKKDATHYFGAYIFERIPPSSAPATSKAPPASAGSQVIAT